MSNPVLDSVLGVVAKSGNTTLKHVMPQLFI